MSRESLEVVSYHQASKHHLHRYASGPGYLDWDTQPDPFRRYHGAALLPLDREPPGDLPLYEPAFVCGSIPPAPLDRRSLSRLFFDSLALSAWKQAGGTRWALRVNPSSGNLHPTEGYLVCGPVEGLCRGGIVGHYAPREHGLEVRAELPEDLTAALFAGLPPAAVLVGFSSIHWREAWKYGERAFRYCQHDVGHAIGAVSIAAAGLGWQATLLDGPGSEAVHALLGLGNVEDPEAEHPDCLLAVHPQGSTCEAWTLPGETVARFRELEWHGEPNRLSPGHVRWAGIDVVASAARKPPSPPDEDFTPTGPRLRTEDSPLSLRKLIHQRRSAVDLDGRTGITRAAFYQILLKALAGPGQVPFNALPWRPRVHPVLFVHRVQDVPPGLYCLVRHPESLDALRAAMDPKFVWERPEGCPTGLELYRLLTGDARAASAQFSCHQEIAADGCFSVAMIAEFSGALEHYGPWFYPRLFWECGLLGQVLYLEAEATGIRGTGIGCFFDDAVHALLGLSGLDYQSLYHFTLGGPVEDTRLTTLPPYPE